MNLFAKSLATAALAGTAFVAMPAAAQVAGIATSVPEAVFARSQARINAYQQIDTAYASQITQIRTLRQETQRLQQSLDTNKDNQLSEAEINANKGVVTQIQQKEQQIGALTQPIVIAQTYALDQLVRDYANVRQQVMTQKKIQIMLTPDAIQYAPNGVDVTTDLVNVLNQRMPSVQATPPAGWQPTREAYAAQQAVQQILLAAAQQQAAQQQAAAAQPGAAQPAPTTPQPTGR